MSTRNENLRIPVEKLRWRCAVESLGFETTGEIAASENFIGQERALKALSLGLKLKAPGYNVYVAGPTGVGKTTLVKTLLSRLKDQGPVPPDIVCVYNFHRADEPHIIHLPAGQGLALAHDMEEFAAWLQSALAPTAGEFSKPAETKRPSSTKPNLEATTAAVQNRFIELQKKYSGGALAAHLERVQAFVLASIEHFSDRGASGMPSFVECRVNVLVDNSRLKGAPVIFETAPNYNNLFGSIGRVQDRDGIWKTNFMQIKAGALAKANGGYLMLNLLDALGESGVWRTLKRALRDCRLEIHAHEPLLPTGVSTLRPEAIPLNVKVIAIADPDEYYHLYRHDDDFSEIFKIRADFDTTMPNVTAAHRQYAGFIKNICHEEDLLPFDRSAVAAVIEFGVWLAGMQSKISTRFGEIADLLREADFWAKDDHTALVSTRHVQRALAEKIYRLRLAEERLFERIRIGRLMIDVDGQRIGQVNALMVLNYLDYVFGYPSRITASVGMGSSGVINIERESDLSGKTHNKGVSIIGGYLRGKYAYDKPLSMSASIAFEQSNSNVDGDSASAAEVCAILSALSGVPLRQDLAITGSMNQKGDIQGIGAANEKIQGFFNACRVKGLTGAQGVIIPQNNLDDLMLHEDVIDAAAKGNFHVYAITNLDEAIELLTGVPAGERDAEGKYPEGTVHYKADQRLRELNKEKKEGKSAEEKKDDKADTEKKESAKPA